MNRNILYTFDYELFLGEKSGSVIKCLIEPTNRIITLFERFKVKGIFFVDTTYLMRLRDVKSEKAKQDYSLIKQQIQQLIIHGHYVFAHVHPHWLDAFYNEQLNEWELLNLSKYRFHNLEETDKQLVFSSSYELLKEIILEVNPAYILDGYRAGGWSIQPFKDFSPYFDKYKIRYDFSVLPGFKSYTIAQYYDFEEAPPMNIYRFNDDVLKPVDVGEYTELTISALDIDSWTKFKSRILDKILWKTGNRSIGDGRGVKAQKIDGESKKVNSSNREMISIELLNFAKLPLYINFLKSKYYMQFISHPKMLSEHNMKCFEIFLRKIHAKYLVETDFRKMIID